MAYIVRMPKLGLEMEAGVVTVWHVDPGDGVEAGDLVAEVESEKTAGEVEAREAGILRRRYVEAGEEVPVSTPLGIVAALDADTGDLETEVAASEFDVGDGERADAAAAPVDGAEASTDGDAADGTTADGTTADGTEDASPPSASGVKASPRARRRAAELDVDLSGVEGTGPEDGIVETDIEAAASGQPEPAVTSADEGGVESADTSADEGGVESAVTSPDQGVESAVERVGESPTSGDSPGASPRARRRAEELGVDLSTVEGTGPGGGTVEADVEAVAEQATTSDAGAGTGDLTVREERRLAGVRRTIADRLGRSDREAVHVTVHREVVADAALDAVEAAEEGLGVDVSLEDVLLLALSATLADHPEFNARVEDGVHTLYEERAVCVAVDSDAGLVAPVVGDLRGQSLSAVARARREAVDTALSGDYGMDDLRGGTFTVSNLGTLGVESFDPVINPPQVAILGVNVVVERARPAEGGGVRFERRLPLDLSFDHRVVDGADAARALATLADHLENPWPLVLAAEG